MTKDELRALNAELIGMLIAMRDRIDEKVEAVEDGDESDGDDSDEGNED
jgi:hypothetical protein